jgi:SPP1 gp7 family putative phage head morphogenesis protein
MPTLSPELIEITARHQVYLERLKSGQAKEFDKVLRAMDRAIRLEFSKVGENPTPRQVDRLIANIGTVIASILDAHIAAHVKATGDLAVYEAGFEARAIQQVTQARAVQVVTPTDSIVRAALSVAPMSVRDNRAGLTVEQLARKFGSDQVERLQNKIRLGYFEGKTTPQLAQEIRGLASLKFQDGELAQVAKAAQIMAKDTFQFASGIGKQATLIENGVKEYELVAILDGRTSVICRSIDQRRFEVGKGPLPPFHRFCRTTVSPVLPDKFKPLTEAATRNSSGGAVDAEQTYYGWLKTQRTEFVEDVLGRDRAKLLLEGGLSADEFARLQLNRNFQPMTLAEMKAKEPEAFAQAGL